MPPLTSAQSAFAAVMFAIGLGLFANLILAPAPPVPVALASASKDQGRVAAKGDLQGRPTQVTRLEPEPIATPAVPPIPDLVTTSEDQDRDPQRPQLALRLQPTVGPRGQFGAGRFASFIKRSGRRASKRRLFATLAALILIFVVGMLADAKATVGSREDGVPFGCLQHSAKSCNAYPLGGVTVTYPANAIKLRFLVGGLLVPVRQNAASIKSGKSTINAKQRGAPEQQSSVMLGSAGSRRSFPTTWHRIPICPSVPMAVPTLTHIRFTVIGSFSKKMSLPSQRCFTRILGRWVERNSARASLI